MEQSRRERYPEPVVSIQWTAPRLRRPTPTSATEDEKEVVVVDSKVRIIAMPVLYPR